MVQYNANTCASKTSDFGPGNTEVGGFPEAISTSCAKEKNTVTVRINRETLRI